jgi:putative OPT family oligopeptide transporter
MASEKPSSGTSGDIVPYISASQSLPEFTLQAVALGIILSLIMCAANVYVGLYAGMTVSAAIPASVISMGVLRGLLRRGTILENNVVHTIASSGESLAAGAIFTIPAIVLLGLWTKFNYVETTLIAMSGGVMGVVMMIPLRRPMIVEQKELRFPEGVACAEVLKAGDRGGAEMLGIFAALAFGGLFKALILIVGLFKESVEWAGRIGRTGFYVGTDISPMLMAVGFIVGWEVALLVFLGGAISFLGALPVLALGADFSNAAPVKVLSDLYRHDVRFFGIGAMVVAGIFSIVKIFGSMGAALRTALRGIRGQEDSAALPRTERSISGRPLLGLLIMSLALSATAYALMTRSALTTTVITLTMSVLAFFFVAVASYIVGLVGSSNSPVSGMTLCTVLVTAGLLLALGHTGPAGMLATLGVAGVVCCAACTSGDICQDLKIGQIVGATPRRLQTGEVIGAMIPALIIAPTMQLLHNAYGIVEPAREGVTALKAPQAAMFKELVQGIFGTEKQLPWNLVACGAAVGAAVILIDVLVLQPRRAKFRLHAMPLAVGMYLPWTVTFPILLGGLVFLAVELWSRARGDRPQVRQAVIHRGLLFSSGLVAGEAIMGIVVAVLMMTRMEMPLLGNWPKKGLLVDLLSLAALGAVMGLLMLRSLRRVGGKTD